MSIKQNLNPEQILNAALDRVKERLDQSVIQDETIRNIIEFVTRSQVRTGVRMLLSCLLAKIHNPQVDARRPYVELGGDNCFSGRGYDEQYITHFINQNGLPCNLTSGFLSPAGRHNQPLTLKANIAGRPKELYKKLTILLDSVQKNRIVASDMLAEVIRILTKMRDEKRLRLNTLLAALREQTGKLPLSSEAISKLIIQHLQWKKASRLPVLVVAAAYKTARECLGEWAKPLESHNAADDVVEYAAKAYDETGGTEIAILDCIGFLRHFLHLFHRLRMDFLNAYQELLLAEPDSAVGQPLKEAFLTLRQVSETYSQDE